MERRQKLKPKRVKFIQEYLVDYDGNAAAIRAGYSQHSARFIAYHLLLNPEVQKELERRKAEIAKKYEIRREDIVEKIRDVVGSCYKDGKLKDSDRYALMKAVDILNKMSGQYTHTVINVTPDQPLFPDK